MSHKELDIWKQMARKADFQLVPPFVAEIEVKHLTKLDGGEECLRTKVKTVEVLTHEFQELHAAWFCNMGYPQFQRLNIATKHDVDTIGVKSWIVFKKKNAHTHTLGVQSFHLELEILPNILQHSTTI